MHATFWQVIVRIKVICIKVKYNIPFKIIIITTIFMLRFFLSQNKNPHNKQLLTTLVKQTSKLLFINLLTPTP